VNTFINENIRILVVDDVLKNIQVIGGLLREKGFMISVAQSGEQAIEVAGVNQPDLILLDVIMPGMNGFETCIRLKQDTALKAVPIIFLTALSETMDKVRGFKVGAVDYVTKPIESEELLARIRLHLTVKILQEDLESQVRIRTEELVRINQALTKREEEYQTVMKAVPDPIIVYDTIGKTRFVNPAFTRVFGWTKEDLLGRRPDFVLPEERERTKKAIDQVYRDGFLPDFQTRRYTRDNQVLDVSISCASFQNSQGEDAGLVANLRDITEWKKTQEAMIQNEKMMSLGGVAAGMAHEIKSPLAAIIQSAQLMDNRLTQKIPANETAAQETGLSLDSLAEYMEKRKITQMLASFKEAGIRVNTIIDNMLSFSRKSTADFRPCSLADLMDRTLELASQDYDFKKKYDFRTIEIVRQYAPDLPRVQCQPSEIQQVFFNILKNGGEAMHESGIASPRFTLTLSQKEDMACFEIADNGPGMAPGVCKRIFDPFFTTKGAGQGTGLGLSVSYFIIKKVHGGGLEVSSVPGKGTCFTICLPLSHTGTRE